MNSKNKIKLLSLIDRYQEGKATDEEIKQLSNFFMSHQETVEWPLENELKDIIKATIFDKIKLETENLSKNKTKVRSLKFKHFMKYAAAIIILAAVTYFFTKEIPISEKPIIVNNTVEIGTNKAILTLNDGSNVALEKGVNFVSNEAESNGEKITYATNENGEKGGEKKIDYNYLTVPRGGEFYIELSDKTKVWLNSESKIKYPVAFSKGENRVVELLFGEAYFEVSSSVKNNGASFSVITQNQEIEVLGTQFNIKAYQDENVIETTLVEGKVSVEIGNKKEVLKPSQQSKYMIKDNVVEIKSIDVDFETAWRTGYFNFMDKPFEDVAKVLARWYDVEFHFENKTLENFKINGVVSKNQNVEYFLLTLKNVGNINYEIKDKHIYIK